MDGSAASVAAQRGLDPIGSICKHAGVSNQIRSKYKARDSKQPQSVSKETFIGSICAGYVKTHINSAYIKLNEGQQEEGYALFSS